MVEPIICREKEALPTPNLDHLTPSARAMALLSPKERIMRLRASRWIGYTLAQKALERLEDLLTWPDRQRMTNMLLMGPTNNGKSMIIEKFRRQHPALSQTDQSAEQIPVLVMQMPSDPSLARFYTTLLCALGAPIAPRTRVSDLEMQALRIMGITQVRILVIDEIHNLLSGPYGVRSEFLNLLRFLGNTLRIPLVGVGTADAYTAISTDDQLENRFQPFVLPRWTEGQETMQLLASFAAFLPLQRPSNLVCPEKARYIVTRTEGTIGEISTLLIRAATIAIESGKEAITNRILSAADYESPTERRKASQHKGAL